MRGEAGQLALSVPPGETEFDWAARLDNKTDAEWVVEHADDYPDRAVDAARAFLTRYPSMQAKELAHNFQFAIEAHHRKAA